MVADFRDDISEAVSACRPDRVLAVGDTAETVLRECLPEGVPLESLDPPRAESLMGRGRYGLVLVAGALETLDKDGGIRLIARLRDLHARRLFVAVPLGSGGWSARDLYGLGLRRAAHCLRAEGGPQLFYFDLESYKQTPEWLNAKYWANPEMWDKYRW